MLLNRSLFALFFLAQVCLISGCSEEPFDMMTVTDRQIEEEFLQYYDQSDLHSFMKSKGRIIAYEGADFEDIDKDQVVPLLDEMTEKFGFEWIILTDPKLKKDAMHIIAKIPPGVAPKEVNEYLLEKLDDFPGDILQAWGSKWFTIEFLDPEETELLRELEEEIVD